MPRFTLDWDSVNDERVILDPGIYDAILESRGLGAKTTQSGNQAFQVRFHILHEGKDVLQITRTYPVEGNGLVFTKRLVRAAGLPVTGKTILDTDALHGRKVRVQIAHQTREVPDDSGQLRTVTYHEVREVLPAGGAPDSGGATPAGTSQAGAPASTDALLQKLLQQAAQQQQAGSTLT